MFRITTIYHTSGKIDVRKTRNTDRIGSFGDKEYFIDEAETEGDCLYKARKRVMRLEIELYGYWKHSRNYYFIINL